MPYFDTLTIAGLAIGSLYLLLPLWFGRETLRVDEQALEHEMHQRQEKKPALKPAEPCFEY